MNAASCHPSVCIVHGADHSNATRQQHCFSNAGWRVLMADLSRMRPTGALPISPSYVRDAKLVFDFFQNINESFNAVLFTETGTASYFCGKARKAMPAICNAALVVDMTDCLEWTLYKHSEPINHLHKLFTVELERACVELADIALMDREQTQWLGRKGWHLPKDVFSCGEMSQLEQSLRQFAETPPALHAPMPDETTLISIVIPTYNRPELLRRAVDSALAQTWKNIEVIIVDDGSTDLAVAPLLSRLEMEPKITVLRQENKHVSAARNAGVRVARGEYVAFLDDDNTLNPVFLSTCLRVLTRTEADVCIPGMNVEDTCDIFFLGGGANLMAQCGLYNVFGDSCCLARRNALAEHPFPETWAAAEDWAMYASMFLDGKNLVCWPEVLLHYNHTPFSLSSTKNEYATFRTHCLPLEAKGKRDLALLSELLVFQADSGTNIRMLVRNKLKKIPAAGAMLARWYDKKGHNESMKQAKMLMESSYFNASWYAAQCQVSPKEEMRAALHYLREGWLKGYTPSAAFDGNAYLDRYPDVKKSGMNPLLHYLQYGKSEGRRNAQ